jgi:hypothetical protein
MTPTDRFNALNTGTQAAVLAAWDRNMQEELPGRISSPPPPRGD